MKIAIVIGTRPEAIKLAPVISALKQCKETITVKVISTGQHREMLDQILPLFDIIPDIDLEVMTPNQSLSSLTSTLFSKISTTLEAEQPDWVIAQGDTTSVFVTSTVCFYQKIKFAHLEAGLRTFDIHSPFPEEFNRRVAGLIADIHFAPTTLCKETLLKEGVAPNKVLVTGNTVIDALLEITAQETSLPFDIPQNQKLILITAHRRENFSQMEDMFLALKDIAVLNPNVHLVYPVHLNPNVKNKAHEILQGVQNISLIAPMGYKEFSHLMKRADLILTDSGGIQEEAPSFGIPVLVMRDSTERPEGIKAGVSELVGTQKDRIITAFQHHARNGFQRHSHPNPYGDGKAADRIKNFFLSCC